MGCFCDDRGKFTALVSDSLVIEPLKPEDSETLWTLLDYGTMASMAPVCQPVPCGKSFSFDKDASVSDFFGESVFSDFALQETVPPAQLGASAYTQPPDLWWGNEEDIA